MGQTNNDAMFGSIAVRLGLVDPNEVRYCTQLWQQSGGQYSLEQILLQRGSLNANSAQVVRQHLHNYHATQQGSHSMPVQGYGQPSSGYINAQPPQSFASNPYQAPPSYTAMTPPSSMAPSGFQQSPNPSDFQSSNFIAPPSTNGGVGSDPNISLTSSMSIQLPEVGDCFGRYRIAEVIGKGGMGIVYKAVHEDLQRTVALKMLLTGGAVSDKQLKRFYTEARSAARLSHPYLVPIHDVGEIDGLHYFTMDYVEGTTLAEESASRSFSEKEALEMIKQIAEALDYAHANDVVHRDLKPANILINHQGVPKITDFGIAKDFQADDGETISGEVLGTPAYMSPEQANGTTRNIDGRSDIFSLGSIMYELLYREQAFQGATQYAIVTQVLTYTPEPPPIEGGRVSRGAEAICYKCLEKKPKDRYAKGIELVQDINLVLQGKKPLAPLRRSGAGMKVSRPFFFGTAGALILLELMFFSVGIWHYNGQRSEYEHIGQLQSEEAQKLLKDLHRRLEEQRIRARILIRQAEQLAEDGEIDNAIERAQNALKLDPENPALKLVLARIILKNGKDLDGAIVLLEPLVDDKSAGKQAQKLLIDALWLKDLGTEVVRESIQKFIKRFPESSGGLFVLRYQGLIAEKDESWQTAYREFSAVLRQTSEDHDIRARLSRALGKLNRWDKALAEAKRALRGNSNLYLAAFVKAKSLLHFKNYNEALQAGEQARDLANDRERREIQELLSEIRRKINTAKPNNPNIGPSIGPNPNLNPKVGLDKAARHKRMHQAFAKARKALQDKDQQNALRYMALAEKFGVHCHDGLNEWGVLLNSMRQYKKAELCFSRAIEIIRKRRIFSPMIVANRAYVRLQQGLHVQALGDVNACQTMLSQAPANSKGGRMPPGYLGKILVDSLNGSLQQATQLSKAKKPKDAIQACDAIIQTFELSTRLRVLRLPAQLNKIHATAHTLRGDQQLRENNKEAAVKDWKRSLQIDPANKAAIDQRLAKVNNS